MCSVLLINPTLFLGSSLSARLFSKICHLKAITLGVFNHKTSVATLKRLRITFECFKYDNFDDKIEINAPSLEYFRFDGHFFFLQKLDNLVEADVNIRKFEVGVSVLI